MKNDCHGDFNSQLTNILAGLNNCPDDRISDEIENALRLVCTFTEIEWAGLWRCSSQEAECFTLMHAYRTNVVDSSGKLVEPSTKWRGEVCQGSPRRAFSGSSVGFPWISEQTKNGRIVLLSNPGQLPAAAHRDQKMLMQLGVRSCAVIPFMVEGKVLAAASFALTQDCAHWPEALVDQLRFITQVLGGGMLREIRDKELRAAVRELGGFKEALEQHAILSMSDLQGRITHVNEKFCALSKYSPEELIGQDHRVLNSGYHSKEFFCEMWSSISRGQAWQGEIKNRAKDGSFYWETSTIVPLLDEHGNPRQYLAISADITEQRLAGEALLKSFEEIKRLKERLEAESAYLQSESRITHAHAQIIGHSAGIKKVLHLVEQVAPAECAVLLTGETGTGKELIAQEIHRLSRRRERLMVLVNCAALPSALVESELFGRERGAYTGALSAQVGRFQVADGSTIFLDEVGELSMEVQAKLLRVLQQGEFQRLGNPKTHKVDVRVIAATNRDLADEVFKGRFREDLYYRLKVFPIELPPLRERIEDIPPMAFAFMEEFSTRMGKKVSKVPRNAMDKLQAHSWPGNIRELRNVIEHSVILTTGDVLKLSVLGDHPIREAEPVTLEEVERKHIVKVLECTDWRIKGVHGAARRLGLEPSTLYSRMQKLGIPNRRQKDEMAAGL
jgi:PAS domain S-box-containing protein